MSHSSHRPGFTMAEMIVVMVLVIVLATVVLTNFVSEVGRGTTGAVAQGISSVEQAVNAFRGQVGRYPSELEDLATPITTGDFDSCGNSMPSQFVDLWKGPYLNRDIPAGGVQTGDATILPTFDREPDDNSATSFGTLAVRVIDVDLDEAEELDDQFDGDSDLNDGSIRWVDGGASPDTLKYVIPIRGC